MAEKVLIVYYSFSGNTENLAKAIHAKVGGEIFKLQPEVPYAGDYNKITEQAKKEIQEGFHPPLKTKVDNVEGYDKIFVGSPNWWNTIAPPLATFLAENNLSGKTILPFYTHGGGGSGSIERDVTKLCGRSKVKPGLSFYGNDISDSQIGTWLKDMV